ncbi:MAG TPA: tetraacyldisaccharide 4'-kinase, partial [Aliiroseovarius sp.]|nr:tetraacyldisaccharide 4'-kinase [Aliiroseovarius sp.]
VRGFGNGYAWPLGPLKRPIQPGLSDADLLITICPDKAQAAFRARWAAALPCPHVSAHLEPLPTGMDWAGLEVVAFAGIGAPERFFATLRGLGARLVATHALEDHRELTPALLIRLQREAAAHGAPLVTTEKDAVRLPAEFRHMVVSLPVRLELEDWQAFGRLMV